jgi:hypothetical protein
MPKIIATVKPILSGLTTVFIGLASNMDKIIPIMAG